MPLIVSSVENPPWGHTQQYCGKDIDVEGNRVTKARGLPEWSSSVIAPSLENPSSFKIKIIKRGDTESFMIGLVQKDFFEPNGPNVKNGWFFFAGTKSAWGGNVTNKQLCGPDAGDVAEGQLIEIQYDRQKGTISVIIGEEGRHRHEAFTDVFTENGVPLCPCCDMYDVGASVELTDHQI